MMAAIRREQPHVNFVVGQRDRKAGGSEIAGGQQAHAGMLGSDPGPGQVVHVAVQGETGTGAD
jgi:hypothetical protein